MNFLKIKNDIIWHLDRIKDEYSFTTKSIVISDVTSNKITVEIFFNPGLSIIEREAIFEYFSEDYYQYLWKHHPEIKKEVFEWLIIV